MSVYALESQDEVKRLELQHQSPNYSILFELNDLDIKLHEGATFLDAGCGSGVAARHVIDQNSEHRITAYGVDSSLSRIEQARDLKENKDYLIHFEVGNLMDLPFQSNFFDLVICRFVYEHNPSNLNALTKEINRVLKPGGRFILIDVDGLLYNLETDHLLVNHCLTLLKDKITFFDSHVCRKIPKYLMRYHFSIDQIKKILLTFYGANDRQHEHDMWVLRFNQARQHFVAILGEELFELFRAKYLEEILNKENFLYYNKFIFVSEKRLSNS